MKFLVLIVVFAACTLSGGCDWSSQQGGSSIAPHTKRQAKSSTVYQVEDFPRMKSDPKFASYERIHLNGIAKVPWAVKMEQRYPEIDHFITHFGMDAKLPNVWNSEAYFGGRYVITLQVPVAIDYEDETLRVTGEPSFFLTEISTVAVDGSGTYGDSLDFGKAEFDKLIESGWDYAAIKFVINPTPVPRFELAMAMAQAPRYPITLWGRNKGQGDGAKSSNK